MLGSLTTDRPAPLPGCEIRAGYRVQALADGYHVEQYCNYQGGTSAKVVTDGVQIHVVEVIDRHDETVFRTLCGRRHRKRGLSQLERSVHPPEEIRASLDLQARTTPVCVTCRDIWDAHDERGHHRKTMSAEEAAWVREHAWLPWMGYFLLHEDRCKWVTCIDCHRGEHHSCRGDKPGPKGRLEPGTRLLPTGYLLRDINDVVLTRPGAVPIFDLHHEDGTWCVCSLSDHHGATTTPGQSTAPRQTQTTIFDFI